MTATSSDRNEAQQKARGVRGLGMPMEGEPTASDGERRPAAAAARGVRILEGEPRLLEVALVVERHAVQILGAEPIDEAAHPGALDHRIVVTGLVLDAQTVAKPRAPAGKHADPQAGGLGRDLLLGHKFPYLGRCLIGEREGDGSGVLRGSHCDPPVTCELRKSRWSCQLSRHEGAPLCDCRSPIGWWSRCTSCSTSPSGCITRVAPVATQRSTSSPEGTSPGGSRARPWSRPPSLPTPLSS